MPRALRKDRAPAACFVSAAAQAGMQLSWGSVVPGLNRRPRDNWTKLPSKAATDTSDLGQPSCIYLFRDHPPSSAMEGQAGREPWSGFVPSPGLRIAHAGPAIAHKFLRRF
jgi:hypothetical protein